jgi:hypothetical protein
MTHQVATIPLLQLLRNISFNTRFSGLFIIQILCLIAAFFLLFASVSLIYGIHTVILRLQNQTYWQLSFLQNSRYLVWPWFPCIVTSILCSIAYCVMWWSGDVRGYWLVLTILEIFSVLINVRIYPKLRNNIQSDL